MPSPAILDLDALLAPIPGDSSTGADLQQDTSPDSPYFRIRDARKDAGVKERAAPGDPEAALPAWGVVEEIGLSALRYKTKDLRFAAYLIEALLRKHGAAGLRDGLRLTRGLVENFWDGLFPMPDEERLVTRVAPLVGLTGDGDREGTLIDPINRLLFTDSRHSKNYRFADHTDAVALETAPPQSRERRISQGAVTLEQIQQSVADTSAVFYVTLRDDLAACLEEFNALSQALVERCGHDAPSASFVRGALQSALDVVLQLLEKMPKAQAIPVTPAAEGPAAQATPFAEPMADVGAVRTREEAFRSLERVAAYFRTHEPHTVVSYTLEQVVRWGRMPLPELLVELIPDDTVRQSLFRQVGIKPPPSQS